MAFQGSALWIAAVSLIGGLVQMTVGAISGGAGPAGVSLWAILVSAALLGERKRAPQKAELRDEMASPAAPST